MATVVEYENFDSEKDAQLLHESLTKTKCDEAVVIAISTTRSSEQRQLIREKYRELFKKDVIADFRSSLKFNFKEVVVALYTKPRVYDVDCLTDAIYGPGTNEAALIEILVSRTNNEIEAIKKIYNALHSKSLLSDIEGDTSGNFKYFLLSLHAGDRDTNLKIDSKKAKQDAQKLYETVETSKRPDEGAILSIVGSLSFPQLRATFNIFEKIAEKDITKTISNKFSGDFKQGLLAIVEAARDLPSFFAKGLYKSMKGLGTEDKRLIRIIVSRSEVDMKEIKIAFLSNYKKTLASFIRDDTSGSYRKILLALISE